MCRMQSQWTWTPETLTGRSREHIVELESPRCALHKDAVAPFLAMRAAAAAEGIDLIPVSSYRDFARQLSIWNAKCAGERALLDRDGTPLDARTLSEEQLVPAILHWSALPGASRHHWGTEIDVIDARFVSEGEPVPLLPGDYSGVGRFAQLGAWLDANANAFGFFRPYASDRGGVQPEPWHLSYAPVSGPALAAFSLEMLSAVLAGSGISAPQTVQQQLPGIWQRYVVNIDPVPAVPGPTPASRPS